LARIATKTIRGSESLLIDWEKPKVIGVAMMKEIL